MIALLSIIPMVLKYWKLGLIGIAALLIAGFCIHLDRTGYQRRVNEDKAQEIKTLTDRLGTITLANALDTQRALADAKLNTQLETLAFDTPPNAGPCLDAASAHRVWAVRNLASGATPVPARRVSNLFQRRPGKP